jgi:hypothetical protein
MGHSQFLHEGYVLPDMEDRCEYTKKAVADRRLEVLFQTVELAVGQQNFTEGKEELASYELLQRVSSGEA